MTSHSFIALAAAATNAVPGFDVAAVGAPQRMSEDWLSTAVTDSAGRRFTVRSARSQTAGLRMAAELPILSALRTPPYAAQLPFAVAKILGSSQSLEGQPLVVYPELPGDVLALELLTPDLARSIGAALGAIHELDPALVTDLDLPAEDAATIRTRLLAEVDDAARTSRMPSSLLNRWEQALEDVALWQFAPCVIHGDISDETLRVAHDEVTAVTGFAGLSIGDPAVDLSWLMASAPEDTLDVLEESYAMARATQPDAHLIDRALLMSELALARWLLHGVRAEDAQVIADAEDMLTTLARQVGDDRPLGRTSPVIDTGWEAGWDDTSDEPTPQA
ncbi:phosphotransferase [Bowdeniella massiliensis]|uniref:phosphotransferase n=1 Tax=Bowdeniella massiliensis TaxID=2932264 RepID=UPI0020291ABE